jgi:glycerol-3-phosphate acyltransferase PlsX
MLLQIKYIARSNLFRLFTFSYYLYVIINAIFDSCIISMFVIAVDAMGGDIGLEATLPACAKFLQQHLDTHIILCGEEAILRSNLSKYKILQERSSIVNASEIVLMHDNIETALRKKRNSSMRVCIEQVKSKKAHVGISSGNTGALMALSHYLLKTIAGIDRPAIATFIPNQKNSGTAVLDLGANADCLAEHLLQFARMAHVMVEAICEIKNPSIGLLNIGEEAIKGNEVVKQAGNLLRESDLNFYGNVEGNDIFLGTTDIVVCDGFVGNIALKSSEGVAKMLSSIIKQSFTQNIFTKLLSIICYPVLRSIKHKVDHRRYNGAMLLGLNGLVIKSHGSADSTAFFHALEYAYEAARQDMVSHMQQMFSK